MNQCRKWLEEEFLEEPPQDGSVSEELLERISFSWNLDGIKKIRKAEWRNVDYIFYVDAPDIDKPWVLMEVHKAHLYEVIEKFESIQQRLHESCKNHVKVYYLKSAL